MLRWSVIFFVIALVSGLAGLGDLGRGAALVGKILFAVYMVPLLLTMIFKVPYRPYQPSVTTS